jgi:transposase
MGKIKNFIGIDVSKQWLDIAVLRPQKTEEALKFKIDNTLTALKSWRTHLRTQGVILNKSTLAILETTGIYGKFVLNFLNTQHCLTCHESALRIKKSMGIQRGKSDVIDALKIAQYGYSHIDNLDFWTSPRKEVLMLRELLNSRERMVGHLNSLKVPLTTIEFFLDKKEAKYLRELNSAAISGLEESLEKINDSIDALVEGDIQLKNQFDLITSVPGVGRIIALNLLFFTNEFKRFKEGKKLACYVGVAPFEYTSGTSTKGKTRIHRTANKTLKRLFHIGALSAIKHQGGEYKSYFDRKVASGKNKMLVINAIRNKMVLRVMAVINRGTPYQKEWISPKYHLNYADIVQAS